MKLNLPSYDLPEKLLGYLFSTVNYFFNICIRKKGRNTYVVLT